MKKIALVLAGVAVVSLSVAALTAHAAAPKPEKGMVIGDVIELSTYAMQGHDDEGVAETYRARIEQGFPVAILEEETGDIWVVVYRDPAPASHLETANSRLLEFAGKKVVVQGLKYKANGVNVIRYSVASEY